MTRPRPICLLLALLVALPLAGCWDFRDLNQRAFIVMLGIDPGGQSRYRVTAQLAVTNPYGRPAQKAPPSRVVAGEGATVVEALQVIRGRLYREPDLSQVGTVVIGAGLARWGLPWLDYLVRSLSLPSATMTALAWDTAEAVVRARSPALAVPAQYAEFGLSETYTRYPGTFAVPIWKLLHRFWPSPLEDEYLPILRPDVYGINFGGAALLAGGELRGRLALPEAELFGFLREGRTAGHVLYADVPELGLRAAAYLLGAKVTRRTRLRGSQPELSVELRVQGRLEELAGMPRLSQAEPARIEAALEAAQAERIRRLLHHLQQLQVDVLGFGELLRREHPDHPLLQSPRRWRAAYAGAAVAVKVDINLVTYGDVR